MIALSDFGVAVKKRLVDLNRTQKWLVDEVQSRTGKYFDNGYLQKLMTGRATSEPMRSVICEILDI